MKFPLPVALTLIFVSQLYYSESKSIVSFFPNTLNLTFKFGDILKNEATPRRLDQSSEEHSSGISEIFVNGYNKVKNFIKNTYESLENEIPDDIVPETEMEYKHSEADEDPIIHQVSMTTPQIIALHGYPAESHTIVTDDGYILTVHRIPFSKTSNKNISPKKTVLLHHGLFGSSVHWVLAGPMKSLGYILSDSGYDVWLANV